MSFIPNTTPTPNWLYNGEMKKMTETELKVVLLVTRKTLGWFDPMISERKLQGYISQSQFMEYTGKSHTAIAQAIQGCVEHGWVIAKDRKGNLCNTSEKRRRRKVRYQLGSVFTQKISKQESGLDEDSDENLSNILAKSKQHNGTNLSNILDNTKETLTKETIQKNTPRPSDSENEINQLFNLFYESINPGLNFGHKTNRAAARWLIEKEGLARALDIANYAISIQGKDFAPVITTPGQLKEKYSRLAIYAKKQRAEVTKKQGRVLVL